MGIFTGNEILFFITGVLSVIFGGLIFLLNKKNPLKWYTWLTSIMGAFMLIFSMNWAVSSILEGEAQAANMGLLIFGIPAIILIGATFKMTSNKKQKTS